MQLTNNQEFRCNKGQFGFIFEMSSGTAKLQIKDHNDSDSAYVDIPDTSSSSSTAFNLDIKNDCSIKVVLTGDAECFMLQAQ